MGFFPKCKHAASKPKQSSFNCITLYSVLASIRNSGENAKAFANTNLTSFHRHISNIIDFSFVFKTTKQDVRDYLNFLDSAQKTTNFTNQLSKYFIFLINLKFCFCLSSKILSFVYWREGCHAADKFRCSLFPFSEF